MFQVMHVWHTLILLEIEIFLFLMYVMAYKEGWFSFANYEFKIFLFSTLELFLLLFNVSLLNNLICFSCFLFSRITEGRKTQVGKWWLKRNNSSFLMYIFHLCFYVFYLFFFYLILFETFSIMERCIFLYFFLF